MLCFLEDFFVVLMPTSHGCCEEPVTLWGKCFVWLLALSLVNAMVTTSSESFTASRVGKKQCAQGM